MAHNTELQFPERYVKAEDLNSGRTAVISEVTSEDIPMRGGTQEGKLVLHFQKTDKQLLLNKTNWLALNVLLGPNSSEWKGKRVRLVPDEDVLKGRNIPSVRVRGSPDATPEATAAFERAWTGGKRMRGGLADRLKMEVNARVLEGLRQFIEPVGADEHESAPAQRIARTQRVQFGDE